MNPELRNKILATIVGLSVAGTGAYKLTEQDRLDYQAMEIAAVVGSYYESSGRHIGTPYIDRVGKGQPLTVCDGITGPAVVPNRYYTPDDCKRLEIDARKTALGLAKAALTHWAEYNVYVRASYIDVAYNVPSALIGTALQAKANAGDLTGACLQMPRWVYGTVGGQKVRLNGLIDRRGTTAELCAEWGRDGHFSADLIAEVKP